MAASRRLIVATFAPRVASAARKAATVSGPAGRAATRLASHQERNKAKSDRYANQTNAQAVSHENKIKCNTAGNRYFAQQVKL
jgi:hypothetical protein